MTEKHKSRTVRLSVGGSSILVIFVILTLTTFATLSLVSAQADHSLSQKSMAAAQDFYAADTRAEEMFAEISEIVAEIRETTNASPGHLPSAFMIMIAAGEIIPDGWEATMTDHDCIVSYTVSINAIQELHVELVVTPVGITRQHWKVVTDPGEEEQDGLSLWFDDDFTLFDGGEFVDDDE
jgi:hypothetical protein